jgi:hypothetical protein
VQALLEFHAALEKAASMSKETDAAQIVAAPTAEAGAYKRLGRSAVGLQV